MSSALHILENEAWLPALVGVGLVAVARRLSLRFLEDRRRVLRTGSEYARYARAPWDPRRPRRSHIAEAVLRAIAAGVLERLRPQRPSLSGGLVSLAVRRLPEEMGAEEKKRWEEEIKADVAAVPGRFRRLLVAYRTLRKGTARMPTGDERTVRRAGD